MSEERVWFQKSLEVMEHAHASFSRSLPPPAKVPCSLGFAYRYLEQTLEQAVIQKLARIVTGLRSAHILIDQGFLQEAAILQRGVDEAQEDTIFLAYGKITGDLTETHEKYLQNFWADSPQSKSAVPRPKIRDYLAAIEAKYTSTSAVEIVQPIIQIYSVYSGYTHAASVHVMELFDGAPPSWKLRGNVHSRLQRDHLYDIRNQYYRGTAAFAIASLIFGDPSTFKQIFTFAEAFLKATELND